MADEVPDRIADPWGTRTPYAAGETWPERVDLHSPTVAEARRRALGRRRPRSCTPTATRLDIARQGRADRGRPRPRRRPRQPRPARAQGPVRLAGQQRARPADTAAGPRRAASCVETDWDDGDGPDRRALAASCSTSRGGWGRIGFYTSGQLFLEEYYTLAVIGKAGIGTPHMDGNTRLCTATAAAALKASFGTDGQPGVVQRHRPLRRDRALRATTSPRRRPCCGCGCSTAGAAPNPPRMLVRRPARRRRSRARPTSTSRPAPGTNLALMNGLHPRADRSAAGSTAATSTRTPSASTSCERTVDDVPAGAGRRDLRRRGRRRPRRGRDARHGASGCCRPCCRASTSRTRRRPRRARSTTSHLLRGMIGRPGAGVLPDERPADRAEHPRDRRRRRPARACATGTTPTTSRELAELWNVEPTTIPHWAPPTHAMQIFRYAEQGSIELLWIIGDQPGRLAAGPGAHPPDPRAGGAAGRRAGPASSPRPRSSPTSCCRRRPGARRRGTFTNADRTVHLSEQAVDPPGEARADLDIFLDYAGGMDFRDRDGDAADHVARRRGGVRGLEGVLAGPAVRLHRPHATTSCAAAAASSGRAPTTAPDGTERLYTDGALQHRPRLLRDLRPGPDHRAPPSASEEYRAQGAARPGLPPRRRLPAAARGARRRVPARC